MTYLALLRGINVGGNNIVSMAMLETAFEQMGFTDVKTYINSGNVIFHAQKSKVADLTKLIESTLEREYGSSIQVLIKTHAEVQRLVAQIPTTWANNTDTKCDVIFLWPDIDTPDLVEQLPFNPDIEEVRYVPGAVLWCIERKLATKSRITRIIGTPMYKRMTIRNPNTVRKVLTLMGSF